MNLLIKNLNKSFENKVIFEDFSYSFASTGLYLIKGESGIGKTTLIRIIAGLDNDYSGTVENGGCSNVSFMFQEYRLFPTISALENTLVAKDNSSKDVETAKNLLCSLGISNDDLHKKPSKLSGGMKQRIAFVRAVMKQAPILILDEPTKELDRATADAMLNIVFSEAKSRLVIMVTHDTGVISDEASIINL